MTAVTTEYINKTLVNRNVHTLQFCRQESNQATKRTKQTTTIWTKYVFTKLTEYSDAITNSVISNKNLGKTRLKRVKLSNI